MTSYYNEIDPNAAQWLRNLIHAGHIAPGIVDERSIEDVYPSDLRGFTQCHFFAGVGVWSHALREAGWADDRPIWTGSCPCQPFSAAGKGGGFDDERHLWPAFQHLIKECKPATVIGEQVASKDSDPWIDLVHTDLEAMGYAFGAVPFPSAGIGAPHIRDRLYWVADAQRTGVRARGRSEDAGKTGSLQGADEEWQRIRPDAGELRGVCGLADSAGAGPQGGQQPWKRDDAQRTTAERNGAVGGLEYPRQNDDTSQVNATHHGQPQAIGPANQPSGPGVSLGGLAYAHGDGCETGHRVRLHGPEHDAERPGPTNGFWGAADWLLCRDGKWRPVEPGTFPLAHGVASRVVRLRAFGNAINAKAAQAFIECVMEAA
jgi:DNA (cytosine-5)-methyltransferase 1